MTTPVREHSHCRHHESGAALIVALILLLVMTLLGVTAMNSSLLQGFMSSSYQQQAVTLATAENLLHTAELEVEDIVFNGVQNKAGRTDYYRNLVTGATPFPAATFNTTWANPFYIEYLGERIVPGESVAIGGGLEDSVVHVFRVSARELRPDDQRGGLRIVQSLYVTLEGPDE